MQKQERVIEDEQKTHNQSYGHNDVITLKGFDQLDGYELEKHKKVNKLLQPGVLRVDPEELLQVAKDEKENWLTDIACLSPQSALAQNIAVKLITDYQVKPDQYSQLSQEIYNDFVQNKKFEEVVKEIDDAMSSDEFDEEVKKNEEKVLDEKKKSDVDGLSDSKLLEVISKTKTPKYLAMNSVTDRIIDEYVDTNLDVFESEFKLNKKVAVEKDLANDYCFLGAPTSGKSTVSKGKNINKENAIIYSTDNYRAFQAPGVEVAEKDIGKDAFINSQDWAYMIKEKVESKIKNLNQEGKRPNIILDLASFNYTMNDMVNAKKLKTYMIGYYGDAFIGIAERAHTRASDPYADLADKGRYVNTESLLESHANSSKFLLTGIPTAAVTEVISTTNGEEELIASIDQNTRSINIYDTKSFADFVNKKNINTKSSDPIELIQQKEGKSLVSHPFVKAEAVLDLLPQEATRYKSGDYTISLSDKNFDKQYANIQLENIDDVKIPRLNVTDADMFKDKINQRSYESKIMKSLIYVIAAKNDPELRDNVNSFNKELQNIHNPEVERELDKVVNQYLEPLNIEVKPKLYIKSHDDINLKLSDVKSQRVKNISKNISKGRRV